ncbi:alcohol dehydrogenase IV [Mycena floridula]|nr:alcohol dehydrogenase IV [Mycena floridula]
MGTGREFVINRNRGYIKVIFFRTSSYTMQGSYAWPESLKSVQYGPGSLGTALPTLLKAAGATKALIVTGRSLYEKTDVVQKVETILKEHNAYGATFSSIGQHAPISGIREAMEVFKLHKCDIIVSVGGGSPIDASKAILYHIQQETGGPMLKQIAIPTTLSAAEYTAGAGFTSEDGHKTGVSSKDLVPSAIILDSELTLHTPEKLWLSSGMRAVDHAIENLYRPGVSLPVKVLCYAAIADLFKYLPLSKSHPESLEFRQKLQLASMMSLWPMQVTGYIYFGSGIGLSHALGHKLGATYSIPHGITSCLTLGSVVTLKAETESQENKETLARALVALGVPTTGSVEGDIRKLGSMITELVQNLGLTSTLGQYNVPHTDLPSIAEKALGSKDDPTYPRVVGLLKALM